MTHSYVILYSSLALKTTSLRRPRKTQKKLSCTGRYRRPRGHLPPDSSAVEAGGRAACGSHRREPCEPLAASWILCVCDETVLDPLFAAVSRPFRTVFRGLGAGFWNLGDKKEKTAKKWGKNEVKWARNGLKKVGPMTD